QNLFALAAQLAADKLLYLRIVQFALPRNILAVEPDDLVAALLARLRIDGRNDVSILPRLESLYGVARQGIKAFYLAFRTRLDRTGGTSSVRVLGKFLCQVAEVLAAIKAIVDHLDLLFCQRIGLYAIGGLSGLSRGQTADVNRGQPVARLDQVEFHLV